MTQIEIVEVAPRDGLQNEADIIATDAKIGLIERAVAAGVRRIEVASFVHPKRVPQMADAEAVVAGLSDRDDVTTIGLVLNMRGLERALGTNVKEMGAVSIATDTFATKNQGQTSWESVDVASSIVKRARAEGRGAQVTLSAAFGCPFEGEVDPNHVVAMAERVAEAEPREIALADTIGVAAPSRVTDLVGRVREAVPHIPLRAHFHNTRNTGVANAWAAVQAGVTTLDSSIGGLGGCPFAPAATGNVPTEDVLYMLDRSGVSTGVNLDAIIATATWLTELMDRPLPGMTSRAGGFPTAREAAAP